MDEALQRKEQVIGAFVDTQVALRNITKTTISNALANELTRKLGDSKGVYVVGMETALR